MDGSSQYLDAYATPPSRSAASVFENKRIQWKFTGSFDLRASLTAGPGTIVIKGLGGPQDYRIPAPILPIPIQRRASLDWVNDLSAHVNRAIALEPNWDSYGAKPTELSAAIQTSLFLINNLNQDQPLPSIVPTNKGGLQIEWHRLHRDLEICFYGSPAVEVFFEDEVTGESYDVSPLSPRSPQLLRYLKLVLGPQR